jgi:hypothetical protein
MFFQGGSMVRPEFKNGKQPAAKILLMAQVYQAPGSGFDITQGAHRA